MNNWNHFNKNKTSINKTYKKIKPLPKKLVMNSITLNFNSKKNTNTRPISSIKSSKKYTELINKLKKLTRKFLKNKIKLKSKELSKKSNILKKKILIFKLKSNLINIKSKKFRFSIRKMKDSKPKKTWNSWKKLKKKSKGKLKSAWKVWLFPFLMHQTSLLHKPNKRNQEKPYHQTPLIQSFQSR